MSWKKNRTDKVADVLRFVGYAFLAFDAIILSAFTLWFTGRFIWHLMQWLDDVFFSRW